MLNPTNTTCACLYSYSYIYSYNIASYVITISLQLHYNAVNLTLLQSLHLGFHRFWQRPMKANISSYICMAIIVHVYSASSHARMQISIAIIRSCALPSYVYSAYKVIYRAMHTAITVAIASQLHIQTYTYNSKQISSRQQQC